MLLAEKNRPFGLRMHWDLLPSRIQAEPGVSRAELARRICYSDQLDFERLNDHASDDDKGAAYA